MEDKTQNEDYNQNENLNQEEFSDEESSYNECAMSNYPEFALEPDKVALEEGVRDGSYVLGFASSLNVLGLSENSLMQIILSKIDFGHQRELLRMHMASEERKTELWSKSKTAFIDTGGID